MINLVMLKLSEKAVRALGSDVRKATSPHGHTRI